MQTYGTFFWLRFRYFLYSCRLLIFRRWQWLLVLSLLLPSQALRTIPAVPGHFLNVITSENIGIAGRTWILLSALAVACLWIMPQAKALRGYNDRSFFSTYPLSRTFLTTVTAGLIFVSDSIFIVLAVGNPAIYRFDAHTPIGLKLSVLFLEFLSFIIFQLGIIEHKKILILSPIISVLPMSAGLQETDTVFRWIFIFISLTILLPPLVSLAIPASQPHKKPNSANIKVIYYNAIMRRITPRVRIQIKSLTEHPVLLSVIILTACGLLIGTIMLLKIFKYDDRTFFTLATGLSATAIALSCLYRPLKKSHDQSKIFTLTLPIKKNIWIFHDIILINSLGISIFTIFMTYIVIFDHFSILNFFILLVCFCILISALRIPILLSQRHSVMLSVFLCILWTILITSSLPTGGGQ